MTSISRRDLLRAGVAGGVAGLALEAPAFSAGGTRPRLTHGVQSGDATADSAVVWTRADRPGRLWVQTSRRPDFRGSRVLRGPVVTPATGFTGKVRLRGLPAGERIFYRVKVESLERPGLFGAPISGELTTAPDRRRDIRFLWTGDVAGQGWGIDPAFGGMRIFESMRLRQPDFLLHSGDTVYADGPLTETVSLPDGRVWRNVLTDAKLKVAETLDEFRGQYAYNLLDEHYRRFAAEVPQINQWDDHEVTNNWYPGEILADARYTEKRVDVLAARARQAYLEWLPLGDTAAPIHRRIPYGPLLDVFVLDMRTVKDPNDGNTYADPSRGLLGRELEFAEVLRSAHRHRITNIVFLTADVHYTAAHHYDPARAAVQDFTPFWEFVSGPAHAGAFGPNVLDGTFGPEAVFVNAPPVANTSPAQGFQHFGEVEIDGGSGDLTVHLRDRDGVALWSRTLRPER